MEEPSFEFMQAWDIWPFPLVQDPHARNQNVAGIEDFLVETISRCGEKRVEWKTDLTTLNIFDLQRPFPKLIIPLRFSDCGIELGIFVDSVLCRNML